MQREIEQEADCLGGRDRAEDVGRAGGELPRELVVSHDLRGYLSRGDHVAAVKEGSERREERLARIEGAHSERREDLVKGEGEKVDVEGLYVDEARRDELRAVDEQIRTVLAVRLGVPTRRGERANVANGILGAEEVRRAGAADEFRALVNQRRHI